MSKDKDEEIKSKLLIVNGNGNEEKDESEKVLLGNKGKKHHKVQWNDDNGNNLTQVLEYQPSEGSDVDEEDSDACICNIM